MSHGDRRGTVRVVMRAPNASSNVDGTAGQPTGRHAVRVVMRAPNGSE